MTTRNEGEATPPATTTGRSVTRRSIAWLKVHLETGLVAVVVVIVVGLGWYFGWRPAAVPARGSIWVDSPEIYTRERLVNDRYQQDDWLNDQLLLAKDLQFSPMAAINRAQNMALGVSAGTSALGEGGADSVGAANAQSPATMPSLTPLEVFHDRNAYRERVRAEIIENQLDDRHDIGGNTLYQLKYDCALVPSSDNSALAVIRVHILPPHSVDSAAVYETWLHQFLDDAKLAFARRADDIVALLTPPPPQAGLALPGTGLASPPVPSERTQADLQTLRKSLTPDPAKCAPKATATLSPQLAEIDCLLGLLATHANTDKRTEIRRALAPSFVKAVGKRYESIGHLTTDGPELAVLELLQLPPNEGRYERGKVLKQSAGKVFVNFEALLNHASFAYTYAVSPEESVDSVATNTSLGAALNLEAGAKSPLNGLSATTRREQALTAALIDRPPRTIGFANALFWAADFGWTIAPRFSSPARADGQPESRQRPSHVSLSAIISAPSWWTEAESQILAYWLDPKTGVCTDELGQPFACPGDEWKAIGSRIRRLNIELPGDIRLLAEVVARRLEQNGSHNDLRQPAIAKADMTPVAIKVGEAAEIVIPGQNLWRNPYVLLGAQPATRVKVLPNMNGIVAQFDAVAAPAGWDGTAPFANARITVWTSQKRPDWVEGKVVVYPSAAMQAALRAPTVVAEAAPR